MIIRIIIFFILYSGVCVLITYVFFSGPGRVCGFVAGGAVIVPAFFARPIRSIVWIRWVDKVC